MSSPSMVHEGVIALVRVLRDLLHVDVPRFDAARLTEAALPELVPVEYHADAVVLFDGVVDDQTKPVLGTIFEVQLERKDRKRYTWPFYAVAARARHECPFILTVVTPDAAVARWADQPIELGNGSFAPCVIGPQGIGEQDQLMPLVADDLGQRVPLLGAVARQVHPVAIAELGRMPRGRGPRLGRPIGRGRGRGGDPAQVLAALLRPRRRGPGLLAGEPAHQLPAAGGLVGSVVGPLDVVQQGEPRPEVQRAAREPQDRDRRRSGAPCANVSTS